MSRCMVYCSVPEIDLHGKRENNPINVNHIITYFKMSQMGKEEVEKPGIGFNLQGLSNPLGWVYNEEKDREADLIKLRKLLEIQVGTRGING